MELIGEELDKKLEELASSKPTPEVLSEIKSLLLQQMDLDKVKIFLNRELLTELLKNSLSSDLIEAVRFAEMQKVSLRSREKFNIHIVKTVDEIGFNLDAMRTLGASEMEVQFIADKYKEYKDSIENEKLIKALND